MAERKDRLDAYDAFQTKVRAWRGPGGETSDFAKDSEGVFRCQLCRSSTVIYRARYQPETHTVVFAYVCKEHAFAEEPLVYATRPARPVPNQKRAKENTEDIEYGSLGLFD